MDFADTFADVMRSITLYYEARVDMAHASATVAATRDQSRLDRLQARLDGVILQAEIDAKSAKAGYDAAYSYIVEERRRIAALHENRIALITQQMEQEQLQADADSQSRAQLAAAQLDVIQRKSEAIQANADAQVIRLDAKAGALKGKAAVIEDLAAEATNLVGRLLSWDLRKEKEPRRPQTQAYVSEPNPNTGPPPSWRYEDHPDHS